MPPLELVFALLAILILSLSFHEAAHAWSADRLGDPTARSLGRLTLNPLAHIDWIGSVLFPLISMTTSLPLIGWAKPVPVNLRNLRSPRRDFAIVAFAGPVSNLILATGLIAIFFLVYPGGITPYEVGRWQDVLIRAIGTNVMLAVFNLIPIPPLDGGNIAIGLLPPTAAGGLIRLQPFGILLLYGLMLSGALAAIIHPVIVFLQWLLFA